MMRQLPWRGVLEEIRRLWLPARRRHPLPAFLDERFDAWPFTDAAIALAPTSPGVYLLYGCGRLIYIGLAANSSGIRQELASHLSGACGECTQRASAFLYELDEDPLALHRSYLRAHSERYGGRLPPCNAV
jgi:hypothetical protein